MRLTKRITPLITIAFGMGLMLYSMNADARWGSGPGNRPGGGQARLSTIVADLPFQELSAEEQDGLTLMREEEKLARDVYQMLYEQWNLSIFSNISQSEQRHMDAVKELLDKYNLTDPVNDSSVGIFTAPELQELYTALMEKGSSSLIDALQVGATIEDLDIKDLYELLGQADNTDIKIVYQNLVKGSRNHLRAFTNQLSLNGAEYEAQYLTAEEINDIITSPRERGRVDIDSGEIGGNNDNSDQLFGRRVGTMPAWRHLLTK